MCAVAALKSSNTWAEDRVYDSDNTPLVAALQANTMPYVTIYTDEDPRVNLGNKELFFAERNLSLVAEIGVASATQATDTRGATLRIPATDEGMEFSVDILESQVINALFGEVYNPWSAFIGDMVLKLVRVSSLRGGSAERGVRWAARQVVFVLDVIGDNPPGVPYPEGHVISRFVQMATDNSPDNPTLTAAANIIQALLDQTVLPDWRQAQAILGVTKKGVTGIGISPVEDTIWFDPVRRTVEPQVQLENVDPLQES